jgi:nicotinamidase-related amidase
VPPRDASASTISTWRSGRKRRSLRTTALLLAARELGFKVTVLADCCATLDPELERIALTYLERVVGSHVTSRS